jgi:hypothetical protein
MPTYGGFSRTWEADEDDQNSVCRKNTENAAKRVRAYARTEESKRGGGILGSFTDQKAPTNPAVEIPQIAPRVR